MLGVKKTVEWLKKKVDNLWIIPSLSFVPGEGWLQWFSRLSDEPPVNPDTISGRLLNENGPASMHGINLRHALAGDLEKLLGQVAPPNLTEAAFATESPDELMSMAAHIKNGEKLVDGEWVPQDDDEDWFGEGPVKMPVPKENIESASYADVSVVALHARATRLAFESGRPIPLSMLGSVEIYRFVIPVFQYPGEGRYRAGEGKFKREIEAEDHVAALDIARHEWYLPFREKEIARTHNDVGEWLKSRKCNVTDIEQDFVKIQLEVDKFLLLYGQAKFLARQVIAHGRYAYGMPEFMRDGERVDGFFYVDKVTAGPVSKAVLWITRMAGERVLFHGDLMSLLKDKYSRRSKGGNTLMSHVYEKHEDGMWLIRKENGQPAGKLKVDTKNARVKLVAAPRSKKGTPREYAYRVPDYINDAVTELDYVAWAIWKIS